DFGATLANVQSFLARHPDAKNINGSPETAAAKFLINGGNDISDNTKLYYNAAYVYKKVKSFANFRTPYWRPLSDDPYLNDFFGNGDDANPSYDGYGPTFEGDLTDY
ncbi:ferric enterobactin receptor, partial [Flavobacterium circumlabens]